MAEKNISVATAVTISGTISGRLISANVADFPRNCPLRTMATAAAIAIDVAVVAASNAMVIEFHAALRNRSASSPVNTSTYQRKDRPDHVVIELDSLKEYTVTTANGA